MVHCDTGTAIYYYTHTESLTKCIVGKVINAKSEVCVCVQYANGVYSFPGKHK